MSDTLINQLQSQLDKLLSARHTAIEEAHAMIQRANRDFDERAIPIMRRLNQLRPPEEQTTVPVPTRKPRKQQEPNLEGLDQSDREHYLELLRKKG